MVSKYYIDQGINLFLLGEVFFFFFFFPVLCPNSRCTIDAAEMPEAQIWCWISALSPSSVTYHLSILRDKSQSLEPLF